MRYIMLVFAVFCASLFATNASACCSYGCCDCSCVSLKLQKLAPRLDSKVKGSLQSFSVNADASKSQNASWKCQMTAKIAMCEKQ